MENHLIERLQRNPQRWQELLQASVRMEVPAKTTLLESGMVARNIYLIEKGCLRAWFNKEGRDITFQFFFEGQGVASVSSFLRDAPSAFSIETIEPSVVRMVRKSDLLPLLADDPELKEVLYDFLFERFEHYMVLFLSRIKDSPGERYEELLKLHPEVLKRVPQHYIASYLGITSVSLSRIRNRRPR